MGEKEKGHTRLISRREMLQAASAGLLGTLRFRPSFSGSRFSGSILASPIFSHPIAAGSMAAEGQQTPPQLPATPFSLASDDDQFLDEVEKRNFQFFWEQASPQTGLVRDRCNVLANGNSVVASIAATGFGLTALCIGQARGFVSLSD